MRTWKSTYNSKLRITYKNTYNFDGRIFDSTPFNDKGQRHGKYRAWYVNGQLEKECNFRNDVTHGVCKKWYSTGQLHHRSRYINGVQVGVHTYWHRDKGIYCKDFYTDGKAIKSVYYHSSGKKSLVEIRLNPHGITKHFDNNKVILSYNHTKEKILFYRKKYMKTICHILTETYKVSPLKLCEILHNYRKEGN